jgi:hypothetical protein
MFAPVPAAPSPPFSHSGAGATYTLSAGVGSFLITGTAASLLFSRRLSANAGAVLITGTNADELFNRALLADAGAFSIIGTDANLIYTPVGLGGGEEIVRWRRRGRR